jgi:hypothetical protein
MGGCLLGHIGPAYLDCLVEQTKTGYRVRDAEDRIVQGDTSLAVSVLQGT